MANKSDFFILEDGVKRTERGWGGHFCCARYCLFRRNTLLEKDNISIVVSTVGNMLNSFNTDDIAPIGANERYSETMVFYSDKTIYKDADVENQINVESKWYLGKDVDDWDINNMHETIVKEMINRLNLGEFSKGVNND